MKNAQPKGLKKICPKLPTGKNPSEKRDGYVQFDGGKRSGDANQLMEKE